MDAEKVDLTKRKVARAEKTWEQREHLNNY